MKKLCAIDHEDMYQYRMCIQSIEVYNQHVNSNMESKKRPCTLTEQVQ